MPIPEVLDAAVASLADELAERYRDLHTHPELSMQEVRTAADVPSVFWFWDGHDPADTRDARHRRPLPARGLPVLPGLTPTVMHRAGASRPDA